MFDEDKSGSMDFAENMHVRLLRKTSRIIFSKLTQAKFAMELSTPEEKLGWIFEIFDADGGDVILVISVILTIETGIFLQK